MKYVDRKKHWENIYQSKQLNEVSWYQSTPQTSLNLLEQLNIPHHAKIIDVGGGDSFLADHLLEKGYQNITVLDISKSAINRAKKRLGTNADRVKWIIADATKYETHDKYDLWHDRAAFHFLTDENEISSYLKTAQKSISADGVFILGTFSEQGPQKCSGIEIKQYSENSMTERLQKYFEKIKCISVDHTTPFNTIQNFVFCCFKKR